MAYKEIQVPNGTVRTIYEDFLKQVKPLAEQQERKNTEQAAINKTHRASEKKLKAQYRALAGDHYNPYLGSLDDYFERYSFGISYTAIEALTDAERMLKAVRFSDGDLTMTADQVEKMESVRNGKLLEYIRKDVEKPLKHPPSFWQKQIDELPNQSTVAEMLTTQKALLTAVGPEKETPGSFGAALAVIGLLSIVVVALIKACGG